MLYSHSSYTDMDSSVACMTAFGVFLSGFVKVTWGVGNRNDRSHKLDGRCYAYDSSDG